MSLFDPPEAVAAARDEAVERVDAHADVDWKAAARAEVERLGRLGLPFTADDVWAYLLVLHPELSTHEPRALGAVVLAAARAGVIRKTGNTVPSKLKRRHGRPVAEWIGV